MKMKTLLYSIFFVSIVFFANAQKTRLASADKKYDHKDFVGAITIYEKAAQKGYKEEKMFQKLGNAYYLNAELVKAERWYSELYLMNNNQEPEFYYRYSQALKSIDDYSKADKMLEIFNQKSGNDLRGQLFKKNKNYLEEIKSNSERYIIIDSGINSALSDFGISALGNSLVFCSARYNGLDSKKKLKYTNQLPTDLYEAEFKMDGSFGAIKKFTKKINSKLNESTPVFTKDGLTMFFTRNNYLNGKKGKDSKGEILLKLYKASFIKGEWTNVKELPFNSDQYSVGHPALSLDEKTLYFASDMPGTLGQSDLFKVSINDNDNYSIPENLGSEINTEGRETFPFISDTNELYFASDGRPGLGGLDIYVAKINKDTSFEDIKNIGRPINGIKDDFAFFINTKTKNGFFSSNREGGNGSDDIYKFVEIRTIICKKLLLGTIMDQDGQQQLANAKVSLFDENFNFLKESSSDDKGHYQFDVLCGKNYFLRVQKEDFETKEGKVFVDKNFEDISFSLALDKRIKTLSVGVDLAKILDIPVIYFALNKSDIQKEAAFQLEKVLVILKQFPNMKIEVLSYTDSRQTAEFNLALSERRAKSTVAWFVNNGVQADRVSGKGYGETKLVNTCSDGVQCTEEEHMKNRRSEFIISQF